MVALIARVVFAFLVPGSLLLLAGVSFGQSTALLPWRPVAVRATLWLVPLLALLLGWRFNRSKPVYLILVLLLAERAVSFYSPMTGGSAGGVAMIVQVVALLLPLNFVVLGLGAERGLFSIHALPRLLLILAQPPLVLLVALRYPQALSVLQSDILPFSLPWKGHLAPIGQLLFCAGLAFLLGRWLVYRGAMENGLFWGLLAAWQGLAFTEGLQLSLAFGVAGLILAAAIVEDAHTMAFRDELTGLPSGAVGIALSRRSICALILDSGGGSRASKCPSS